MMAVKVVSDHALVRWIERRHNVNIEDWRELLRADANASVDAYRITMRRATVGPAFLLSNDGTEVVTYYSDGWPVDRLTSGVSIPAYEIPRKQARVA